MTYTTSVDRTSWHSCFNEVFFPMLTRLMGDIQTGDRMNLEETRVRASYLLCKVRINGGGMRRREREG